MTAGKLIEILKTADEYDVVICEDETGGWDNILDVHVGASGVRIVFGGGSPFSDE